MAVVCTANANNRWVETTDELDRKIGSRNWIDVNWTRHATNPNIRIYNYYGNYQDIEISQGVVQIDCKLKIKNLIVIQHTNQKTGAVTRKEYTEWLSFHLFAKEYDPYRLICG
jgi:hypothetical protein